MLFRSETAQVLKKDEHCDIVICLSHLGYQRKDGNPDCKMLARESEHIDMIISGHNQELMDGQLVMQNKNKHEVIISQAAWNGLMIGKTVFSFGNGKQKSNIDARYLVPGQPCGQKFAASFAGLRLIKEQSVLA